MRMPTDATFGGEDTVDKGFGNVGGKNIILLHLFENPAGGRDGVQEKRDATGSSHKTGKAGIGFLMLVAGGIEFAAQLAQLDDAFF